MKSITVTVFRNTQGYNPDGSRKTISTDVDVIGYEVLREADFNLVSDNSNKLLKVFSESTGPLWIDDTLSSLQTKINAANSSGGGSVTPIQFTIGDAQAGTPVAGTSSYTNTLMAGRTRTTCLIHLNQVGYLEEGVDFTFKVGGGFDLLGEQLFADSTHWVIELL